MAVAEMESGWKEGRRHAVECALKSFFDTVNHDRLMRPDWASSVLTLPREITRIWIDDSELGGVEPYRH